MPEHRPAMRSFGALAITARRTHAREQDSFGRTRHRDRSNSVSVLSVARSRTFSRMVSWASSVRWIIARTSSAPFGRTIDRRQLGGVARITDCDPAQALDPLREQVDDLGLLLGVLVEQQVELVEGRPGHEPVVLLVERVEDHRVGQDLVQELAALGSCRLPPGRSAATGGPEALDLDAERRELRLRRHARRRSDDDPLPWVFTLGAMFDTSVRSDRHAAIRPGTTHSLADEQRIW